MNYMILTNEGTLDEVFVPTRILHREDQLRELERCLKPALHNKSIQNVFLVGVPGTGKTAIARWVLENYFKEASAYVNCWKCRTTHQVLKEILLSIQIPVHGREPTADLINKLGKLIGKRKIIVCLDEVDRLRKFDVLYMLPRSNCGLLLISTYCHALINLANRIKSSLVLTKIEFPTYNVDELYDILEDRAKFAFRSGTLKDELIKIASVAARGDVRAGLEILRKAGKKAEVRGLNKITVHEIKEAIAEASRLQKFYPLHRLNEHQMIIYGILGKKKRTLSGLLYREYCKLVAKPVVKRAYRNYMRKMVELGLVKSEGFGRWKNYEIIT